MTTLLIDADDTLWENIVVFNAVNHAYVEWLLPGRTVTEMQPELDALQIECIAEYGYGRETFEKSLIKGIRRFGGRAATSRDRDHVAALVRPLQWETIEVHDGVVDTLANLATRTRLLLVTKGDREEQQLKIDRSGLAHFFAAIEILNQKSPAEYAEIMGKHALEPASTWMVGNSPRSDIAPALEVGIGAVYIPHPATWSHEQADVEDHPRLVRLRTFRELTDQF